MKVSVIVPVYNHARYLRQRLDSILNQSYKDYELIILDDGSSDDSRDVIQDYVKNYPWIITCFNITNNGSPFKQWNKGVRLSRGKYIWIAESDDYADNYFLERVLQEITKSENIGLVFTDTWVIDEEKGIKYRFSDRRKNKVDNVKKLTMNFIVNNPIPNASSIIFRRDAYQNAGYADESMKFCADWYLSIKIASTQELVFIPDALSTYRLHKSSSYHKHFMSNRILIEKWKICLFLIKNSVLSVGLYFKIAEIMIKVVLLRSMRFVNLPSFLMPEIPRRPKRFMKYI